MPVKYELYPLKEDDWWGVKLLEGTFENVIFKFYDIKFVGEDEEGNGILKFDYDILESAGLMKEELTSKDFETTIGDILLKLITDSIEYAANRDKDSRESNQE